MNPVQILFGVVFLGLGLLIVVGGGQRIRDAVVIWRSDPVPVRTAAQDTGTDEFEGTVEAWEQEPAFEAPFSGSDAVLSTYKVEKRKNTNSNNNSGSKWRKIASGEIRQPFVVRDETGAVVVDPAGADIEPGNESVRIKEGGKLPSGIRFRLSELTDQFDLNAVLAQNASRRQRYTEGFISPGDDVHIYGTALAERTPTGSSADARVQASESGSVYKISAGDESATIKRNFGAGVVIILFGLIFAGAGLFILWTGFV